MPSLLDDFCAQLQVDSALLDDETKLFLTYHYVEELPLEEVARKMGVPISHLEMLNTRFLRQCRDGGQILH